MTIATNGRRRCVGRRTRSPPYGACVDSAGAIHQRAAKGARIHRYCPLWWTACYGSDYRTVSSVPGRRSVVVTRAWSAEDSGEENAQAVEERREHCCHLLGKSRSASVGFLEDHKATDSDAQDCAAIHFRYVVAAGFCGQGRRERMPGIWCSTKVFSSRMRTAGVAGCWRADRPVRERPARQPPG